MIARLARVLVAVALLAGWQAALLHPLEHFDEQGGFVHLADGHSGDRHSDGTAPCDALAALGACVADAQACFEAPAPLCLQAFSPESGRHLAQAPPFLAQGPPALL